MKNELINKRDDRDTVRRGEANTMRAGWAKFRGVDQVMRDGIRMFGQGILR